MAAPGTITRLSTGGPATIARKPSYWMFDVALDEGEGEKSTRLTFPTHLEAYQAQYNAVTCGFKVTEVVGVHRVEG